jgi:COP9 signalosome complex subunit 1
MRLTAAYQSPGATRIDRLHHIGSHSPYLAVEAYRLATAAAKKGKNVNLYTNLVAELSEIAPQDPAALTDTTWAEKKAQETQREQDRLEHELKSYKNNLIKESIRVRIPYKQLVRARAHLNTDGK